MAFFKTFFNSLLPTLIGFTETIERVFLLPIGFYFLELKNLIGSIFGSNVFLMPIKVVLDACLTGLANMSMSINLIEFLMMNFLALLLLRFVRSLVG